MSKANLPIPELFSAGIILYTELFEIKSLDFILLRKALQIFLLLIILPLAGRGAERKIVIDSLAIGNDDLFVNYHIDGLLNDKIIEGLERGFTSQIVHHVELWKKKKVMSSISGEIVHTFSIYYDNWERKFVIITEDEKRITSQIEILREHCAVIKNLPIAKISSLEQKGKYYVSISVAFQPMSAESYQELRQWLSGQGNPDEKVKPKRNRRGRFFGVLLDLMGFGDKSFTFKSKDFILQDPKHISFSQ